MQPRSGLMRQLHAIAAQRGISHEDLRALFRVQSLTQVPDRDLRTWIDQHNRTMPQETKRRRDGETKRKPDKRTYLRQLMGEMEADGWPHSEIEQTLDFNGVDLESPVLRAGSVSRCITQLWRMRHNGWIAKGIEPIPDTRMARRAEPVVQSSALPAEATCST
jgi:hypothetical protein